MKSIQITCQQEVEDLTRRLQQAETEIAKSQVSCSLTMRQSIQVREERLGVCGGRSIERASSRSIFRDRQRE